MDMFDLNDMKINELLKLYAQIEQELKSRKVRRSNNNPVGDLAEYLFCRAFGWRQAPNSQKGYDAIGMDNKRYQIKGRRLHPGNQSRNQSRQLSAIRNIEGKKFDMLAAVLFDQYYKVTHAAIVPREVVEQNSSYQKHTNSHRFTLRDNVWSLDGVIDATEDIRNAEQTLTG